MSIIKTISPTQVMVKNGVGIKFLKYFIPTCPVIAKWCRLFAYISIKTSNPIKPGQVFTWSLTVCNGVLGNVVGTGLKVITPDKHGQEF